MSASSQRSLIWIGYICMLIYGLVLWGLLKMMPPPAATLSPAEVAQFYTTNSFDIRLGAIMASWVSAFMVPISVVATAQMMRLEKGIPIWSILNLAGGILMSMFLVFPPLFWGVAAYNPTRPPEVTALMHEFGTLTLVTTDQFYIFQDLAIVVMCLSGKPDPLSPYPRWFGYFTIWIAFMFELGAIAFIPKTGPFSWRGLFVYWSPLTLFGVWLTVFVYLLLRSIRRQAAAAATAA